jgi:asparagine synthase (glutamine-hydrolysing)
MCGIAGWALRPGKDLDASCINGMIDAIGHRGPDDRGFFFDAPRGIALSNNRLSIIDLSLFGHLPMVSEDGSVVLGYNGEVYNFKELRSELESLGQRFRSRTDSEVVLRAFIQWGIDFLPRLSGMFGLAIWSAKDEKLYLARDPLGMKPLYYTALPGGQGFAFASEIKAFLAIPGFEARANRWALTQFLEFGYTFDHQATSLEGVKKVPPGHYIEVSHGSPVEPRPYFILPRADRRLPDRVHDREQELHDTLSRVVSQHLVADVPVGLLLSGGIDSSVIAAVAARETRIRTITMSFAESGIDERPFARAVADFIASDHDEISITPREITEGLEDTVWYFDDLFADWGTLTTRMLYKKCREKGLKVVLVGEGSDELFGGYPCFPFALKTRGPLLARLFFLYRHYAGRRYGSQFQRFASIMRGYISRTGGSMFEAVRLFETRNQLPNNFVMKVDKASMSVSLEARAPFLDRRVAELAYRTPQNLLLAQGTDKLLLRSMAERFKLLPPAIARRPKYGASIAASWMDESEELRKYARQVVLERNGWTDELGLRPAMTDYFTKRRQGYSFPHEISIFRNVAWRLLLLNLWSRRYAGA